MSATVYWEPTDEEHQTFDVSAPSRFTEIMGARFGGGPWEVCTADLDWLKGVSDAQKGGRCADWEEIMDAVRQFKRIKVWKE